MMFFIHVVNKAVMERLISKAVFDIQLVYSVSLLNMHDVVSVAIVVGLVCLLRNVSGKVTSPYPYF